MAWKNRRMTSSVIDVANAHATAHPIKSRRPPINTGRRPTRSLKAPTNSWGNANTEQKRR